jgi:hypothetical protein
MGAIQQLSLYLNSDNQEPLANILNPSWMQVFNNIIDVIVNTHSMAVCSSMNMISALYA